MDVTSHPGVCPWGDALTEPSQGGAVLPGVGLCWQPALHHLPQPSGAPCLFVDSFIPLICMV